MISLGLGKTKFNSSVALYNPSEKIVTKAMEVFLMERHTRLKATGVWPEQAIKYFSPKLLHQEYLIAENRDVDDPLVHEEGINIQIPFFDFLAKKDLINFSRKFNSKIKFFSHHLVHAYTAMAMSPYENCFILVMDGGGSRNKDINHPIENNFLDINRPESNEEYSLYLMTEGKLQCLFKGFQSFDKVNGKWLSAGMGALYENVSEYIFNSNQAAGKVMGLAACHKVDEIKKMDRLFFQKEMDWSQAFKGKGKIDWEEHPSSSLYLEMSYRVQREFEANLFSVFDRAKAMYPHINQIILGGGCALNCTANAKILNKKYFSEVYVTPFPGDESVGFGCAYANAFENDLVDWRPLDHKDQISFLGAKTSVPKDSEIETIFKDFMVEKKSDIADFSAQFISQNKVIAWFQGQSECGPRALGHRSILASVKFPDLKNYLNNKIKFREDFRPYGCSVLWDVAHQYFNIPPGFNNPFMSFALDVHSQYKDLLKEVSHVDGTSRMQTIRPQQDALFYELIKKVGKYTGVPIVLNTSLNVMHEPILETPIDAKRFFENSLVDALVVGNYFVTKGTPF
jgi:carbamoyltransferase